MQFLQSADWTAWVVSVLAALFIGISKAGFGGALGLLSTPLCVLAFGPRDAIGILLPLLCAGDAFSLYPYWRKWDARNLKYLLPGVIAGVLVGVQLIGQFSPRQLNVAIGILAIVFVCFQLARDFILRAEGTFAPNHAIGIPFGIAAGITSTFAHGAGPVVTMFLVPQRLPKEIFVGTMVLTFTWVNWIKLPFFVGSSIINRHTFELSLLFLPLIPLGVWLGVRLNRTISESSFLWIIYAITLLAGLQLILDLDLRGLWERVRARTAAPVSLLSAKDCALAMGCGLGSEQLGRYEVFQGGRSQVFALEADDRAFGEAERLLVFQSQQGPDAFGQGRFVAHEQQMLRLRQGAQPGFKTFLRGFVGERVDPLELSGRDRAAAVEHCFGSLAGPHQGAGIGRVKDHTGFLEESPHSPGLLPSAGRERARRVVGAGQRVGMPHEVESHIAINPERPAVSNSLGASLRDFT